MVEVKKFARVIDYGPEYVLSFLGIEDSWPPGARVWRMVYLPSFHAEFLVELTAYQGPPRLRLVAASSSIWRWAYAQAQAQTGTPRPVAGSPLPVPREVSATLPDSALADYEALSIPEDRSPGRGMDGITVHGVHVDSSGAVSRFQRWSPSESSDVRAWMFATQLLGSAAAAFAGRHEVACLPFGELDMYFR